MMIRVGICHVMAKESFGIKILVDVCFILSLCLLLYNVLSGFNTCTSKVKPGTIC